jgi:hypothetical protein
VPRVALVRAGVVSHVVVAVLMICRHRMAGQVHGLQSIESSPAGDRQRRPPRTPTLFREPLIGPARLAGSVRCICHRAAASPRRPLCGCGNVANTAREAPSTQAPDLRAPHVSIARTPTVMAMHSTAAFPGAPRRCVRRLPPREALPTGCDLRARTRRAPGPARPHPRNAPGQTLSRRRRGRPRCPVPCPLPCRTRDRNAHVVSRQLTASGRSAEVDQISSSRCGGRVPLPLPKPRAVTFRLSGQCAAQVHAGVTSSGPNPTLMR